MAVKLVIDDPKKDQLVPVKALKEFGTALGEEALKDPSFMEKMFKSEEKREEKTAKIKAIAEAIRKIGSAPGNKRAWFAKFFLVPFDGNASKEAKELFEAISKTEGFKNLQSATNQYNKTFKTNTDATATAAANLTSALEKILTPATAQFAEAYKAKPPPPPPPPPPPVKESILKSFNLDKKLYEAGLITDSEYLASLTQTKIVLLEADTDTVIDAALKQAQKENVAIKSVEDLQNYLRNSKVPAWKGTTLPTKKNPYTIEMLNAAKKKAGYTIGTPPPPPPATDPVLSGLSTLTGKTNPEEGELVKLAKDSASFQQVMTDLGKTVITEALTPKQKELVKLSVQKQVLSEYIKTGEVATKTQLNEFFLMALLFAALTAVAGWVIKTFSELLVKSLTGTEPSGRSRQNDSVKDVSNIAAALGAGYSPDGQMTDVNGQTVADVQQVIDNFKTTLTDKSNVITRAVQLIKGGMTTKTPPPTYGAFDRAFTRSPATEITALNAALDKLKAY